MRPQAQLADMPVHIQRDIFAYTDYRTRVNLRKVSSAIRSNVNHLKMHMQTIRLSVLKDHLKIDANQTFETRIGMMYSEHPEGCLIRRTENGNEIRSVVVRGGDFMEMAITDLMLALSNNKLTLDAFQVVVDPASPFDACLPIIRSMIEALKRPVHTRTFQADFDGDVWQALMLLPYMKADFLRGVTLSQLNSRSESVLELDGLMELEQFRHVEKLSTTTFRIEGPLDAWMHIPNLLIGVVELNRKNMMMFVDNFVEQEATDHWTIKFDRINRREVTEVLGDDYRTSRFASFIRFYQVPDVTDYELAVTILLDSVELNKQFYVRR